VSGEPFRPSLRLVVASAIGVAGVLAVGVLALDLVPKWLASTNGLGPKDAAEELARTRTAALAFLAGVVASIGAVYTARTFALSREGQLTERFTRAVDQIGHQALDVRIGGIYALERIAKDSARDQQAVLEVLTAFVRERGRKTADPAAPPPDVQAALTVIGRRRPKNDPPEFRINLEGAELGNANLARAHLERASLTRAQLEGAILAEAYLQEAWFIEAHLEGASLIGAQLRDAKLGGAYLERAVLYDADLQGADLHQARLHETVFGDSAPHGKPGPFMHRASMQARTKTLGAVPARFGRQGGPANLSGATLEGAEFTLNTRWPPGFSPESCGARLRAPSS
jgi:Pentapeptide repeats (8 copies)